MYREARELFKVTVKQGAYTAKDGVVILLHSGVEKV